MMETVKIAPDGTRIAITNKWVRVTQNPIYSTEYPKAGQTVTLKGHNLMPDGEYLIVQVEEFEPAFFKDKDGRDIRFTIYPNYKGVGRGLNGENFINAMVIDENKS